MKKLLQRINWKRVDVILGIIVVIVLIAIFKPKNTDETKAEEVVQKKAVETVSFGHWEPNGRREVLATVEASGEFDILAEVNGTIEDIFVAIGDHVEKGDLLATFTQSNDATQISYENALVSLQSTQASAKNSVLSAEIALETAKRALEQTKNTENQSYSQTYDTLRTRTYNSQTVLQQTIDWADRTLGVENFQFEVDFARGQIGSNNSLLKQTLKNKIQELVRAREGFQTTKTDSPGDILWFAERNLGLLKQTQSMVRDLDTLIRQTPIHANFTSTTRDGFQSAAEGYSVNIANEVYTLETLIESAKSSSEGNELSILAAENQVKNAEAALELAKASASAQVSGAQSQYRLAEKSKKNLNVYAPYDGTISTVFINPYFQVAAGTQLFSFVSDNIGKYVWGYVTTEEFHRMETHPEEIKIQLENGSVISPDTSYISSRMDSDTQKMEVQLSITDPCEKTEEEQCEFTAVGSLARIILPAKNGVSTLLPISSISFEPDGAEVFVVKDGKVERRKVTTGKIVSDALEVLSGLEIGDDIITYRKRVHAGELVELKQ